jgi:hypothetical protein
MWIIVWVLCQLLFEALRQHLFGVLCQQLFGYYVSFCLGCYVSIYFGYHVSICLGYYVNNCLDIMSAFVWGIMSAFVWGIMSAFLWVLCQLLFGVLRQHLFGYCFSIFRDSISWLLPLIEKFTDFCRTCVRCSSPLIHIISQMSPIYIPTVSLKSTVVLSTSHIRFGLHFGLSYENNVLQFILCVLHTPLNMSSLTRSPSNRYRVFVIGRYPWPGTSLDRRLSYQFEEKVLSVSVSETVLWHWNKGFCKT